MTGHLQIKKGNYYAVINTYFSGKREQKWIPTGYPVKGNKIRAERFLREQIALFEKREENPECAILFSSYIEYWLNYVKPSVDDITYQGYDKLAKNHLIPYFNTRKICLGDINREVLQTYVNEKFTNGRLNGKGGLSAKSLRQHRNVLNQTLKLATASGLIQQNPCTYVKFPQVQRYEAKFYTAKQMEELLDAIKDDPTFYLLVKITATYGLRRSEVLGLQWNSIDFEKGRIQISHTVVKMNTTVRKDKTKSSSSYRMYPLLKDIMELLLKERKRQEKNRREFGKEYMDSSYIFVWDDGKPYATEYVSQHFKRLLIWNNLPIIRFHDLRHSCASILLSNGFTLKDVQEWMGHADITLTANIYGHLDIERKINIANELNTIF